MKILNLVLTHKWYDMIASGTKKEEYREIKKFYIDRLTDGMIHGTEDEPYINTKHYDYICFHRGYTKTSMLVELKGIRIGKGNPDWGAPEEPVFILSLGEILEETK